MHYVIHRWTTYRKRDWKNERMNYMNDSSWISTSNDEIHLYQRPEMENLADVAAVAYQGSWHKVKEKGRC